MNNTPPPPPVWPQGINPNLEVRVHPPRQPPIPPPRLQPQPHPNVQPYVRRIAINQQKKKRAWIIWLSCLIGGLILTISFFLNSTLGSSGNIIPSNNQPSQTERLIRAIDYFLGK